MKHPFLIALLTLSFILPTVNTRAESLSAEEALQIELVEQQIMSELTVEKLQHGIDVVRETATDEEKVVLDSLQLELNKVVSSDEDPTPRKQTKVGKIATKVGSTIMKGYFHALRPFLYAAGYVRARVEKKKRFDDRTGNDVMDFFARIGNLLRDKGEIVAAKIAERIVSGDQVTSGEIELLVTAFPKLDMSGGELAGAYFGQFAGMIVVTKVLAVAGLGAVASPIFSAGILSTLASTIPCMFSDIGKHPNQNLIDYCDKIAEDGYVIMMKAKIRGYLHGVQDRNQK